MSLKEKEEVKKILDGLTDEVYYLIKYNYNLPLELSIERIMTLHRVSIQDVSPFVLGCSNLSSDGIYNELDVYEVIPITEKTRLTFPVLEGVRMELDTLIKSEVLERILTILEDEERLIIKINDEPYLLEICGT